MTSRATGTRDQVGWAGEGHGKMKPQALRWWGWKHVEFARMKGRSDQLKGRLFLSH